MRFAALREVLRLKSRHDKHHLRDFRMGGSVTSKEIFIFIKNEEYQSKMIIRTYDNENLLKDSI